MKKIIRLTERDLSRIVKRVINESSNDMDSETIIQSYDDRDPKTQKKIDECIKQNMKEFRLDNPEYFTLLKRIDEWSKLEWWEWYDYLTLQPTMEDYQKLVMYQQKMKKEVFNVCLSKYLPKDNI